MMVTSEWRWYVAGTYCLYSAGAGVPCRVYGSPKGAFTVWSTDPVEYGHCVRQPAL